MNAVGARVKTHTPLAMTYECAYTTTHPDPRTSSGSSKGAVLSGASSIGASARRDHVDAAQGRNLACFSRKLLAKCNSGRSDCASLHIVRS